MNDPLYKLCLEAATRIVAAEKALYPGCEGAVNVSFGGNNSDQESKFSRVGTSVSDINYTIPAFLQDLITRNANTASSEASLGATESTLLSNLMQKDINSLPNVSVPQSMAVMSPTTFTGSSNLANIAARDPFSSQFEEATQAAYEQRASDAMAQVQSGPDAVRGGEARSGIAQGVMADRLAQGRGDEVRKAQLQDAGLAMGASQVSNQVENTRRGISLGSQSQVANQVHTQDKNAIDAAKVLDGRKVSNLAALQLASDLLGTKKGTNTDNLSGAGSQTNDSFNWGVNLLGGCCFIFLQALNGQLPWYIEKARHDYYTGARRHGYKWMANWLVPLMRKSLAWSRAVNVLVVLPFLAYGKWLYKDRSAKWYHSLAGPYCEMWLAAWSVLGTLFANRKVD